MKRYSHSSTPLAPRVARSKHPPSFLESSPQSQRTSLVDPRKLAWESHRLHQHVQPFRRKRRRSSLGPPKCVPPLDLSQFNQPDELMEPVEILPPNTAGAQSLLSWGEQFPREAGVANSSHCTADSYRPADSVASHQPVEAPGESVVPERKLHNHQEELHNNRFDGVEARVVSQERELALLNGEDHKSFGLTVPHASLHKRLRFDACIATQNGRDIHRELCGFFFLTDSSITIYEFRQFGKKSSALPLIQRGVYRHCVGKSTGEAYEINYITKGSVLQFDCKNHPGLPHSLATQRLLFIRIIDVDEMRKRRLLTEGLDPAQCQQVVTYLSTPIAWVSQREGNLLQTLQGMFRHRLSGRASKTLVGLGQHLRANAEENVITFLQLQQALRKFHICLTSEDMQQLWHLLSKHGLYFEESKGIHLDFCLFALTGRYSEDEANSVRTIFRRLDIFKSGSVQVEQMKKYFIDTVSDHHTLWSDMFATLNLKADQSSIPYPDFENFHLGLSVEVSSDSKFIDLMRTHWGI